MNYKNNKTFEPTAGASVRYLKSLGIECVDSFLYKPKPSDYESPWKLNNMRRLVDELHDGFVNNKSFFIQVDSDADGFTSSTIFINFFLKLYPDAKITWRVHEGKEHGVIVDTVPFGTDIVIIPDAGSNQVDEFHELTVERPMKVLVMDHHIINHPSNFDNVVIVNNQDSKDFNNKHLSGAGVVYKVIQAYDEIYNNKSGLYKEFEDLAALGIIADAMDSRTLDNNAIIKNGLNNINNPMIMAMLAQQEFKIGQGKAPNKIDIAFYIAPLINAVIRYGTIEEKSEFFEGFINSNSTELIQSHSRGKEREETLYQYLARTASNLRNRQNRAKEKSIETICEKIDRQGLDKHQAIIVNVDVSYLSQTITGLAAMEISKIYGGKPTLLLRPVLETKEENGEKVEYLYRRGSGRASVAEGFTSFMEVLKKSGYMEYVEGHDNAFGASILEDDIPKLVEFLDKELDGIDFSDYNEVDCCMDDSNWDNICLKEFGEIVDVFGSGIPQPKFHFDFQVRDRDFRIQGKREDSLKIQYNGVVFVSFLNRSLVEQYIELSKECASSKKEIHVECIGRSQINEWMGYKNINIMIDNIELSLCEPKRKALF